MRRLRRRPSRTGTTRSKNDNSGDRDTVRDENIRWAEDQAAGFAKAAKWARDQNNPYLAERVNRHLDNMLDHRNTWKNDR